MLHNKTNLSFSKNMQSNLNFFVLLLVLFSYELPNSILIAKARNLPHSNGPSFSVDLIHRDKTTNKSHKRGILGSISSNHHFRLSSTYYKKIENTFNTEIIPNGGDYLMKIAIGTPPVEFMGVADTGSDPFWVQCSPCQRCIPQESPLFDPTKSSTYKAIPCNSQNCSYPDLESGCIPNSNNNASCIYKNDYGDGLTSFGVLATDTITFNSSTNFPSFILGCGFDQQGHFGLHGDGIFGLGNGPLSLVSQLGTNINHTFAYCLTPLSSSVNGKLRFGSSVMGPGVVSTPFMIQNPPTFYYLTLDGITIGNRSIPAGQDVIIDSGTTLTYLETSVYEGIRTTLKDGIGLSPVTDPAQVFDPCYEVKQSGEVFNTPDVVFKFKGADVVLKTVNTFRTLGNLTCLAIVPTDDTFIFGNIAQVNFEVGYDLHANQVSFAPTDCTKY